MNITTAAIYNRLHAIDRDGMSAEARAEIDNMMLEIMLDLRASAAKPTEANAAKMVADMLKNERSSRECLHYAWKIKATARLETPWVSKSPAATADGQIEDLNAAPQELQCATDGFRAYRFTRHMDSLPAMPDGVQPIDLAPLFSQHVRTSNRPIPRPDSAEVKAYIELERAKHGRKHAPLWDFGPGLPTVNAVYLYELLTIFPDAIIYADPRTPFNPLYATSDIGDAMLLPVRVQNKPAQNTPAQQDKAREVLQAAAAGDNLLTLEQFAAAFAA